jgi:topoisomerase IA-like protein
MAEKIKNGKKQESNQRPTSKSIEAHPLHQIFIYDYNGRYKCFINLGMTDAILSHNKFSKHHLKLYCLGDKT